MVVFLPGKEHREEVILMLKLISEILSAVAIGAALGLGVVAANWHLLPHP